MSDLVWSRRYIAVRADEVRPGDLYANGATVTESRKPRGREGRGIRRNGEQVPVEDCWTIKCSGAAWQMTTLADKPVVVGRDPLDEAREQYRAAHDEEVAGLRKTLEKYR